MKLVKCINNHYYNAEKLPYCPHCANEASGLSPEQLAGMGQQSIDTVSVSKNTAVFQKYTVGWLVCINGNMKGDSFSLYSGTNEIGRNPNMNVCLSKEPTIRRESHATILYDNNNHTFILSASTDSNPVLQNGNLVTEPVTLTTRDLLILGECELLFIALCDDNFSW